MSIMLEQKRAARAWERVRAVRDTAGDTAESVQKRYRSQTRGGPAMIQRNGLGQFFAFLAASGFKGGSPAPPDKAKEHADRLLYQHLGAWLLREVGGQPNELPDQVKPGAGKAKDPLDFLLDPATTMEQTVWATREALAFLQWARRFAESQLKEPDPQDD